ncbi:MAG TPA: DUF1566 domain-containing protein, partial [Campylobacterales bacterium]|nr:DUF1566 domain-containing protein [Campylobacterales bacterium]
MYIKTLSISISIALGLLLTLCVSSPATRGSGSASYATRDVELVAGNTQTYPRIALIIGNNEYERGNTLTNAVPDARAMRKFLQDKGFEVVYAENANIDKMRDKVDEFMGGLGQKSVAVIYYSGHASQDKSRMYNGEITNYLIPVNNNSLTTISDYDRKAISLNSILDKADEINHGLNIAMLDACRTSIGKGNSPIKNIGAEGVYLVYSTASGVTASDSGIFRKSFIRNANKPLKLIEIMEAVKLDVYRKEGQSPSVANDKRGTFYFTAPTQPTPTPVVKPQVVERIVYRDRPVSRVNSEKLKVKSGWNPKIYRGERSYSKNSTNTVKDNYTGLIWQKEDDEQKRSWDEAKGYCTNLSLDSYSDWRLPTMEELYYLGDMTKVKPAIDTNYFNVKNSWYWSSTTYKNNSSSAWNVYFEYGDDGWDGKSHKSLALCV